MSKSPLRAFVVFSLAALATGCPAGSGDDAGAVDSGTADAGPGDAGSADAGSDAGADAGVPDAGPLGFTLTTVSAGIDAGEVATYCWFFRTPNTAAQAVRAWRSSAGPGVHYVGVWLTPNDVMPPGTLSVGGCDQSGTNMTWAYSAWTRDAGWAFPSDDGTGKPIGKLLAANQAGFVLLQVLNPTADTVLETQTRIDVELYAPDAGVTHAEPFVTHAGNISVGPGATTTISNTCPAPPGARFTRMSVFTHRYATQTAVLDGAATLFSSTNWEDPGATTWGAPSFFTPTGSLEYRCTYVNQTNRTVMTGANWQLDESCTVMSYFFPATRPRECFNNILLP